MWFKHGVDHPAKPESGENIQSTQVPDQPGVYTLQLGDTGILHRLGVSHPPFEHQAPSKKEQQVSVMKEKGFNILDAKSEFPEPKGGLKPLKRMTGHPWHSHWAYFAAAVFIWPYTGCF